MLFFLFFRFLFLSRTTFMIFFFTSDTDRNSNISFLFFFSDALHTLMNHVAKNGISVPHIMKNLKGEDISLEKIYHSENITGYREIIWLNRIKGNFRDLTFLKGLPRQLFSSALPWEIVAGKERGGWGACYCPYR